MKGILTFVLLAIAGWAVAGQVPLPDSEARADAREVSMYSLLGNPERFDGKVVRVIGVAYFRSGFEGRWLLYPTPDDEAHSTGAGIEIGNLIPTLTEHRERFDSLTGKYVIVEGVFKFSPAREPPSGMSCSGCDDSFTIQDVSRLEEWEF